MHEIKRQPARLSFPLYPSANGPNQPCHKRSGARNGSAGLARRLLMYHDPTGTDALSLTHENISLMLGVRRASVTHAIHNLEATAHIHAQRGLITIRDRRGLEEYSGRLYGVAEERYCAIIGEPPKAASLHTV